MRGPKVKWRRRNCVCEPDMGMGYLVRLDSTERRKQRTFLKKHLTQDLRMYNTKFIKVFSDVDSQELMEQSLHVPGRQVLLPRTHHTSARQRRSTGEEQVATGHTEEDMVDAFVKDEEIRDLDVTINTLSDELESLESNIAATVVSASNTSTSLPESPESPRHGCRVTGSTVGCTDDVYRDPQAWRLSKVAIDQQIRRLRHQLIVMKDIRKHLRDTRPDSLREYDDYEDDDDVAADYSTLLDDLEDTTASTTTTTSTDTTTDTSTTTTNATSVEAEEGSGVGASTTSPDVTLASVTPASVGGGEVQVEEQEEGRQSGEGVDGATHLQEIDDDVLYGTDYSTGSSQESQGEEEESNESQTGLEDGARSGWVSASHPSLGTTRFEVFPVRAASGYRQTSIASENETSARAQCWCNRNFRLEQKQVERDRKRQERLKLRLERQWMKHRRRQTKAKKKMRKIKNTLAQCNYTMLNCYTHDNDHWRTPPLWHDGKFCFCMNAVNNTYWCVRTINQTHNFLYCEFITGLVTYYDLNIDPYQLRNVAFTLSNKRLAELHRRLEALRTCVGATHCDDLPQASQSTASVPQLDLHQEEPQLEEEDPGDNRVEVHEAFPRRSQEREERRRLREERQQHREERRRQRKEHKKWKRHQLQALRGHQVLQSMGSNKHIIRLPRKSRMHGQRRDSERRREKRRERKRRKESRKVRIS